MTVLEVRVLELANYKTLTSYFLFLPNLTFFSSVD